MKTFYITLIAVCCSRFITAKYCNSNDPVSEGSSGTITNYVDKDSLTNGKLYWRSKNILGWLVKGTECDIDTLTCKQLNFNAWKSTIEKYSSNLYKTTLTSDPVERARDQTDWSWHSSSKMLGECFLKVYAFESGPECNDIKFSKDKKTVEWTCTVDNVYPDDMECQFQYRKGKSESFKSLETEQTKITDTGIFPVRTSYTDYMCILDLPIRKLRGAGNYEFYLNAVLDLGSKEDNQAGESQELKLVLPHAELVDCPGFSEETHEYIKEGTTKTCKCKLVDVGNPPGVSKWLNSRGHTVGISHSDGEISILSLSYNNQDHSSTYTCQGASLIGEGTNTTYSPKFAYGPSNVSISVHGEEDPTTFNMCEPDASFTIFSDVPKKDVNPRPTMTVTASDLSTIIHQQDSETAEYYRYEYKVIPEKGEKFLTCLATNAIFDDLTFGERVYVTVREPPLLRPVMIIDNGKIVSNGDFVTVTSGKKVEVKCRVDGGYPAVSKVTITCDGVETFKDGVEATHILFVTEEENDKRCECEAEHITGCYELTIQITLGVFANPIPIPGPGNAKTEDTSKLYEDVRLWAGLVVGVVVLTAVLVVVKMKVKKPCTADSSQDQERQERTSYQGTIMNDYDSLYTTSSRMSEGSDAYLEVASQQQEHQPRIPHQETIVNDNASLCTIDSRGQCLRSDSYLEASSRLSERSGSYLEAASRLGERSDSYLEAASRLGERSGSYLEASSRLGERSDSYLEAASRLGERSDTYLGAASRLGERSDSYLEAASGPAESLERNSLRMSDVADDELMQPDNVYVNQGYQCHLEPMDTGNTLDNPEDSINHHEETMQQEEENPETIQQQQNQRQVPQQLQHLQQQRQLHEQQQQQE